MKLLDEGAPNPSGDALLDELRWIHSVIRANLATITALVEQISAGVSVEHLRAQLDQIAATSVVWTLRVDCMRYCRLVHGHHHHEDAAWFPALRRANPAIHTIIDTLEADHRLISQHLDAVEAAAAYIDVDASARTTLTDALHSLGEHLLAHLDYEEENLAPTLRRLAL